MSDNEAWRLWHKDNMLQPSSVAEARRAFIAGRASVTVNADLLAACQKVKGYAETFLADAGKHDASVAVLAAVFLGAVRDAIAKAEPAGGAPCQN